MNYASVTTKNYYVTTRTTATTSHKPSCSTRPPLFTQPVKNNTGQLTSHKPRFQQHRRMPRCTNSISTTTTTTFYETATHLRISTHFTHVSRHKYSSFTIISFCTDLINRTDCYDALRYKTLRHTVTKITFCS